MTRWKLLAAVPFLMLPLAYAGISAGDGIEHQDSRAAVVLPSAVTGPQVTLRPKADPVGPDKGGPGSGGPRPEGQPGLDCDQDDLDDQQDGDDDRDDEVEIVQPCPDVVGDDDDDDDGGEGDGDDADDD